MKLSQALKAKNRIIGELNQLKAVFTRENSRRDDNTSKVDREAIFTKIGSLQSDLIALKAQIAAANVPIYAKIEYMSELKSWLSYLKTVPVREGTEDEAIGYGSSPVIKTRVWTAFLNQEAVDRLMKQVQDQINLLQDEIDAFNATTSI